MGALVWLVRRAGPGRLLTGGLLGLALLLGAWTLSALVRGLDLDLLTTMVVVGGIVGWRFGGMSDEGGSPLENSGMRGASRSKLWGILEVVAVFAVGAVVTTWVRVGQLGDELLGILSAGGDIRTLPDAAGLWHRLMALERLVAGAVTLYGRLSAWGVSLRSGQAVFEPVATALVWSFVFWLLAAWAAWMVRRAANPLYALAPLLLLVAWALVVTGSAPWAMIALCGMLLGLMALAPHMARTREWERQAVPASDELGFDLTLSVVPLVLALVTAVVIVPAWSPAAIERAVNAWLRPEVRTQTANAVSNSFGLVPAPRATTAFDPVSVPGLPRSHLLGAGPELLHKLALTIELSGPELTAPRWLSTTYDRYTGRGWITSGLELLAFDANERTGETTDAAHVTVWTTVRNSRGDGLVYAPGPVRSVDHPFGIARRTNDDVFGAQAQAQVYRVEADIPVYDEAALRAANGAYPEWVTARYLGLPEDVPARVTALARDLTATAPTAYDRARAIESYLREIPYSLDVPEPPARREVTDYFLFDLQRGYCDYYATAMAVLARAAGLPARLAVGYASGSYDAERGEYTVREAEAHAWTQVYFTGYGWVDFEPTRGRAAPGRAEPLTQGGPPPRGEVSSEPTAGEAAGTAVRWGGVALVVLGAAALVWLGAEAWRWRRLQPGAVVTRLYGRVYATAARLGVAVRPSDTPHEVVGKLASHFEEGQRARQAAWWGPARATVEAITAWYEKTTYGGRAPDRAESARLVESWARARGRVWLVIAVRRLGLEDRLR